MPDTGSLLFVLDSRLKGRKEPKKRKCSKHFDSGMAIDLRYNESFYVPSGPSAAFSLPLADALHGGYRVEAFEDDDQDQINGDEGGVPVGDHAIIVEAKLRSAGRKSAR